MRKEENKTVENGLNLTVNRLPARAWNRLKMNESHLSHIVVDGKHPVVCELPSDGGGLSWKEGEPGQTEDMAAWAGIETGLGPDMDLLAEGILPDTLTATAEGGSGDTAFLDFAYRAGEQSFNRVHLSAGDDSVLNAAVVLRPQVPAAGNPPAETAGTALTGMAAVQFKIRAGRGAKVRLYVVQLLGAEDVCLLDVGGVCGEDASVEMVRLELGAGELYAGALMDLAGDRSSFDVRIGYIGKASRRIDMNYTARHRGKRTESRMDAGGVLEDGSFKLFRATIDFLPGCAGSRGEEQEEVLLLGDRLVNQTIPLILCGEEDVEGNHGASIGRLDDGTLFYLGSRGISPEAARQMIARARIDALCGQIPSKRLRGLVQDYLDGGKGGAAYGEF